LESIAQLGVMVCRDPFPCHSITGRNFDVWGIFAGNEQSYSYEMLIDIREHICVEYSILYLESIALLGVEL